MSLRARVVLIVMLLAAAAALAAGAAVVTNARAAVRAETLAALSAAELAVKALARGGEGADPAALSRLLGPRDLRHVRISVAAEGATLPPLPVGNGAVPAWFAALVWDEPVSRALRLPGGTVLLEADPRDELAEAWSDALALAWIAGAALILLLLIVQVAVSRALAPLTGFERALEALSRGEREVAADAATVPELAAIGARIRELDRSLSQARRENADLSRLLLDLQDRERRELARELHDELGPLLFGIRVDAHAIARAAGAAGGGADAVGGRADAIAAAAGQIRDLSRRILGRLRPMALDHVALGDVLLDLMEGMRRQHPDVAITLEMPPDLPVLGEAVDLTIYRVVQEGVLNALRHGQARHVAVRVAVEAGRLTVTVADDGCGLNGAGQGHGILGMRERVQALTGTLRLESGAGGGTIVTARIPLPGIEDCGREAGRG